MMQRFLSRKYCSASQEVSTLLVYTEKGLEVKEEQVISLKDNRSLLA